MRDTLNNIGSPNVATEKPLADRIAAVYEATGTAMQLQQIEVLGVEWGHPGGLGVHDAETIFQHKMEEPKFFLLKALRRVLLWPLLKRQVQFNHAVRSTLLMLWRERDELRRSLDETNRRVAALEESLSALQGGTKAIPSSNGNNSQ